MSSNLNFIRALIAIASARAASHLASGQGFVFGHLLATDWNTLRSINPQTGQARVLFDAGRRLHDVVYNPASGSAFVVAEGPTYSSREILPIYTSLATSLGLLALIHWRRSI